MLKRILCYFVIMMFIFPMTSNSSDYKIEFDKNWSITSGVTNMSTFYFALSDLQDNYDNVRFKIFNSGVLSIVVSFVGHEMFGHGFLLRKHNINHGYRIGLMGWSTYYDKVQNNDLKLNIVINGMKFNGELTKEARKDQVTNQIDYKNSLLLIRQKFIPLICFRDKGDGSDYLAYEKFNPKNDFKKHIVISMLDPTFLYSILCTSYLFISNEEKEFRVNYIPFLSIDFGIYEHETSNLFTIAKKIDDHYINFLYENGSKHDGCGFEITNIKFTKSISLDYKFHYFNGYDHSVIIYHNHFYTRFNYENHNYDISNNIQIGYKF